MSSEKQASCILRSGQIVAEFQEPCSSRAASPTRDVPHLNPELEVLRLPDDRHSGSAGNVESVQLVEGDTTCGFVEV